MVFMLFRKEIEEAKLSEPVKAHMRELLILYGLDVLVKDSNLLFEAEYFGPGHATQVFEAKKDQIAKVRPYTIPLVESFGWTDSHLCSTIGNSYGDIYEQQLEVAKNSKMNKQKLPKGYEHFMNMMKSPAL